MQAAPGGLHARVMDEVAQRMPIHRLEVIQCLVSSPYFLLFSTLSDTIHLSGSSKLVQGRLAGKFLVCVLAGPGPIDRRTALALADLPQPHNK
jgi:hypothetical protein